MFYSNNFQLSSAPFNAELFQNAAHLAIDVQRKFADPEFNNKAGTELTDNTAKKISKAHERFEALGIPTYWVFFYEHHENPSEPSKCGGGFYRVKPNADETFVGKCRESVFADERALPKLTHDTYLVSGYNAGACVLRSVLGGLRTNFNMIVMRDLIENGKSVFMDKETALEFMEEEGALVTQSSHIFRALSKK